MALENEVCPFFSVIIPTFNRKSHVLSAIDSVLQQTFDDFELIVIDDGSTDGTGNAVEKLADPRITYLSQSHSGASAARNAGIKIAKGEYVSFLDSDDLFLKVKLERVREEIVKFPDESILISSHKRQKNNNSTICYHPAKRLTPPEFKQLLHYYLIDSSTSGLVIKRSALLNIGGFDIALKCIQDRELLFRLCNDYGCVLIADILWQKNWTDDSIVALIKQRHYIPSLLEIADRNPSFKSDYSDAFHYLIFRTFIKNILRARFDKVVSDFRALKSEKKMPKNIFTIFKDYWHVRQFRRRYRYASGR